MRISVVLAALPLFCLLGSCGKHLSTGVTIDSALRKFVSPDTTTLAGIDLDKLKTTDFYKRYQELLNAPLLNGMSQQAGFDPRRDLAHMLIAWDGKDMFYTANGRFAKQQIEAQLSKSTKPTSFEGHTLFTNGNGALALLSDQVAVAGDTASVKNAIEGQSHDDMPDELAHRLSALPKADQVWIVSRGSLPFADVHMRSDYASILSNFNGFIKGTSLGIAASSGLHIKAQIDCVSDEGAKRVNDALRGGIGLARLSTKDNQMDLLKAYDAIHVTTGPQTVYVDADLPADLVDKLVGQFVSFDFYFGLSHR